MGKIGKALALSLTLIIIMSCLTLLTVNPVNAQSTASPYPYPYPPPATPDFRLTCTNNNLNVIITNQPFTPFNETLLINDRNMSLPVSLYYNVQVKEHSDCNWTDVYSWGPERPIQSESNYTVVMYSLGEGPIFGNLSYGSLVDIQVQAMVGSWVYQQVFPPINPHFPFPYEWTFYGTVGNWSGTETITLENGANPTSLLSTPTPTSSPTIPIPTHITGLPPENPPLVIVTIIVIVIITLLAVIVLFLNKMRRHQKTR